MIVLPSAVLAVSPSPASVACAAWPRVATIAMDPAEAIEAVPGQSFVIALRATHDGGYAWKLAVASRTESVKHEQTVSIDDVAYQNLGSVAAHRPPMVGGQATEYWVFDAVAPGTTKLPFALKRSFGNATAVDTKTFTVVVKRC